jgi:hypothetical protein
MVLRPGKSVGFKYILKVSIIFEISSQKIGVFSETGVLQVFSRIEFGVGYYQPPAMVVIVLERTMKSASAVLTENGMSSNEEKKEYLSEHLFYELLMLRYTAMQLKEVREQLAWNSFFESFGVHARNLYDFARNERDSRNFKASDFVDKFDCGENESIRGLMEKLRQ